MAKPTFKTNPRTQQVLEDLDLYREFCQDFGYRWNEADLYNFRSMRSNNLTSLPKAKLLRINGTRMLDALRDIVNHEKTILHGSRTL